jgi:hypothetical protein
MPMTLRYPTLVTLGGVALTEEGRKPVPESRDERSVSKELASGKIRKYIKKSARKWTVEWELVPVSSSKTIDGKGGRDEIRALAYAQTTKVLILNDGYHSAETYTVWIDDYQEECILRRGIDSRYRITIELTEQ